jgi:hypothetical protein
VIAWLPAIACHLDSSWWQLSSCCEVSTGLASRRRPCKAVPDCKLVSDTLVTVLLLHCHFGHG